MIQSLILAINSNIKTAYHADYGQIGLITLAFQVSASPLQPAVGFYTDKDPMPDSMIAGLGGMQPHRPNRAGLCQELRVLAGRRRLCGPGVLQFPIPRRRAWRATPQVDDRDWRKASSRSAARPAGQWDRCSPPSSSSRLEASLSWFSIAALVAMALMTWIAGRHADITRFGETLPVAESGQSRRG